MCTRYRSFNWRLFFSHWRLWISPFLAVLYVFVLFIIILSIFVVNLKNKRKLNQSILWASVFVLLALPISIWQIVQHIIHYTKPSLQKHIIRILWMVPIYAVDAWLGLLFPQTSIYVDSLRECYEAFVIYNFMKFLLNYLNEHQDLVEVLEYKPQVNHIFPFCFLTPWNMGREFIHMCNHGILQYTVVRPLTAIVSVICELCGVYGESDLSPRNAYPYMIAINNLSQFIAMYCLVLFYKACCVELRPMKPISKFLCIKAVVFFSFFQGVIINILAYYGVISKVFDIDDSSSVRVISNILQDFLICIEMFFAAMAHHFSFTYRVYLDESQANSTCYSSFLAMFDVSDVKRDITEHIGVVGSSFSRRLRGKSGYNLTKGYDESTRLVSESTPSTSISNVTTQNVETETDHNITKTVYGSIDTTLLNDNIDSNERNNSDENIC